MKLKYPIGTKVKFKNTYIKVMAYADKYYMVRFRSCMPFVVDEAELTERIERYRNSPANMNKL